ncbi:GNAT family N-acetyltransferase [Chitinophaga nivalis]|uniref:GNAT family N-acetyltransferase n=1 Tax=Chitinophaga nivalis TaxID=2991709 RepID=A0ABT3IMW4_9BACT|nr:GNAT family N-acetyltransferase [Chitinophaga nivalis]MCW3465183.1 GNAT family N-acetyltransferase [Chitinophaga nivalis]MCW3485125.1 GNAT family N-acetyltransferase [Chitinophaga nivalis]
MTYYTDRLLLDALQPSDLTRYFEIFSDPATNLYNPSGPLKSLEEARAIFDRQLTHWTEHHFGTWAIKLKDDPATLIGFGGLTYRKYGDELKLNLGYRFDKDHWGKGYATELAKYAIDFCFNHLQKETVWALVRPYNTVSVKVLEKAGMLLVSDLDDVPGEVKSLVFQATR